MVECSTKEGSVPSRFLNEAAALQIGTVPSPRLLVNVQWSGLDARSAVYSHNLVSRMSPVTLISWTAGGLAMIELSLRALARPSSSTCRRAPPGRYSSGSHPLFQLFAS